MPRSKRIQPGAADFRRASAATPAGRRGTGASDWTGARSVVHRSVVCCRVADELRRTGRRFSDFDGVAVSLKDRDGSFWPIASFRCYATIRRLSGGHSGLWQAVRPAHLWVHGLGVDPNVAMVFTRLRYELSELSKLSKLASIQSLVRSALRNRRERRPWVLFL
jgi:hypothetical protein